MEDDVKVKSVCMNSEAINRSLKRMAHEVLEKNGSAENLVIVGIVTRGDVLAKRLVDEIESIEGVKVPLGRLDISFYRDDYATYLAPVLHATEIPCNIDGRDVVLVDDILYTGRTIRAALDALRDYGRPQTVQLAVLVDRGHRQLPIRADYVGKNIPSAKDETVRAYLEEIDGINQVQIQEVGTGSRIGSAPVGGEE